MRPTFHFDLETFLIVPGCQAPPPVCLQFAVDDGKEEIIHVKDPAFRTTVEWALTRALMDGHNVAYDAVVLCAAFPDLIPAIFQAYREDRILCTKIRQSLIDIALGEFEGNGFRRWGYTLGECVFRASDGKVLLDKSDPWRLKYGTLYSTPVKDWPPEALHYALMDATGQRLLFNAQEPGVSRGILKDQFRKSRTAFWLHLMETWGMRTDLPRVQEFHRLTLAEMARDRKVAEAAGLIKPDGVRDTKAAMDRMVRVMLELDEMPELTESGENQLERSKALGGERVSVVDVYLETGKYIKVDEDACLTSGDDILQAYQRYGSSKVLMSRIERLYKGAEVPLQSRFSPIRETGRTSCQMGEVKSGESPPAWGFQLQNTPRHTTRVCECGYPEDDHGHGKLSQAPCSDTFKRDHDVGIKECFVPRPGFVISSVDGDTMELHSWAQCCLWAVGRSRMAEVLNRGDDPHTELGATLAHISKAEAYAIRKRERGAEAKKAFDEGPRQSGKIADFGFPGGMGAAAMRKQARALYRVFMTLAEAGGLKEAWKAEWPEAPLYFDWVSNLIGGRRNWDPEAPPPTGTVEAFMSGLVRGKVTFTAACNFFFQALTASSMTDAGFPLAWECYVGTYYDGRAGTSPLFGSRIINFVHDEYLLEVPEGERAHHAAYRQRDLMVEIVQKWHPDVRVTAAPALMRRWSKAAEETKNGDGMLIPWEDKR